MAISRKFQNSRGHNAGVTAILPLPGTELVVTGSYDEHIRLFGEDPRRGMLFLFFECFTVTETLLQNLKRV
jgi:hypothetical protein